MSKSVLVVAAGAALSISSAASAAMTLIDFAFNSTAAAYNSATNSLQAQGVDNIADGVRTTGNVRRYDVTPGTANYDLGTGAGAIAMNLAVSAIGPTSAIGSGTLTITDANNDTITATVSGTFINGGSAVFFNGFLSNVALNNTSGDNTFNGPSGGGFSMSTAGLGSLSGSIIYLELGNAGNFFTNSFNTVVTQVSGAIVPAPASLALLGLGGLVAGRRRR
jgi:hypothetical protein